MSSRGKAEESRLENSFKDEMLRAAQHDNRPELQLTTLPQSWEEKVDRSFEVWAGFN
jgi:hypothetical protein